MDRMIKTLVGGGALLAIALLVVPAEAQVPAWRGELGGPYYRGANNPSGYYRDFSRFEGAFAGRAPLGAYGAFSPRRNRAGRFDTGNAFGAGVAGPFGDYTGYGNYNYGSYYTSDWYNWRW